jgi:hypothetical protein
MLALVNGGQPLIPATGISYHDGIRVLTCFLWLVSLGPRLGASAATGPYHTAQSIIRDTPFLAALQRFIAMLQCNAHNEHRDSVRKTWECAPPFSQLAVCYQALKHVDNLVDLVLRLVQPPCGTLPYIQVVSDASDDDATTTPAVTPYYTGDASPHEGHSFASESEDSVLAAIATWERETRDYWQRVVIVLHKSQLHAPPAQFVDGDVPAPPGSSGDTGGRGGGASPPVTRTAANTQQRTANAAASKKGKQPTSAMSSSPAQPLKATQPMLQWAPTIDKDVKDHGPAQFLTSVGYKPKFPAKNQEGAGADQSSMICMQFTLEGVNPCRRGSACKFAHLDAATAVPNEVHYAALRKFLAMPAVQGSMIATPAGKRFIGTSN